MFGGEDDGETETNERRVRLFGEADGNVVFSVLERSVPDPSSFFL